MRPRPLIRVTQSSIGHWLFFVAVAYLWRRGHYISPVCFHYGLLCWRNVTELGGHTGASAQLYFLRQKNSQQPRTFPEHEVFCEFSPARQINAEHRHPKNKTRERQGPFCERKRKRIGQPASISMHTLCARATMKPEINAAVGFLSRFLRIKGHVNDRQLQSFSQTLQDILTGKGHSQRLTHAY